MFLRIENLSKFFGPIRALDNISMEVGPDELLVILGPTGAGKTTLLRVLAGLEKPDQGRVFIEDQDITAQSPAGRDLALVFQNFSLYPDWTVRQNLEFPLRAPGRNLSSEEICGRIDEASGLLHIEKLLDKPAQKLSGGEMQRVAIGRAIVRKPRLFLMDEPLTNLDAKLREELRVELVELRRRLKVPMIFVTHDQQEAFAMADRLSVLDQGRVLQADTPDEIYHHPLSPQVALQLGQPAINLIPSANIPSPAGGRVREREGLDVVGLRPEDIELSGGSEEAQVLIVEDQGPVKVIVLDWLGQEVRVLAEPSSTLKPGDRVKPSYDPSKVLRWSDSLLPQL